jgi:2-polyprenyl-3-methyl-5-hydroxy-6-metoxy-1,4-benzoquinol methylase
VTTDGSLFEDYLANHLGPLQDGAKRNRLEYFRHNYRRHLPIDTHAPILDFGCGRGEFMEFVRDGGYTNVNGADISPDVVEYVAQRFPGRVERVLDLDQFGREHAGRYQLVALLEVLEHLQVDDAVGFLRQLKSLLGPSGRLLVETPNGEAPFAHAFMYDDLTHVRLYTAQSLHHVLRLAGYQEIAVHPLAIPLTRPARYVQAATQKAIHAAVTVLRIMEGSLHARMLTPVVYAVAS